MPAPVAPAPAKRSSWDWALTLVTVGLLGSLGAQSLIGTLYAWFATRTVPDWEALHYGAFVGAMNAVAAPQVVALVVVMGLCVPKRLFSRGALIAVSAAMVAVGLVAWAASGSMTAGMAVYLALAALIQVAVVVMTVAGAAAPSYLTQGRVAKAGSGLLHLGVVLFTLVVVALQDSAWMLPVFGVSALLILAGTAMSVYATPVAKGVRARG
ncbi:MAG: hypothetical protein FDZ70_09510 [Actinobacteria bacterium]|nr:MAG: hypothetical protein FDZ70_09510 [Actinomycetota bacterium]